MDGATFDAWTRRRLNLALGGAGLSALLGVLSMSDAQGKKKKQKKRCAKKAENRCTDKKPCCKGKGLECLPPISNPTGPARCCKTGLKPCIAASECCSNECTDGVCACKSNGQECAGIGTICCSLKCQVTGDTSQCVP
jgi:hypothetical protein